MVEELKRNISENNAVNDIDNEVRKDNSAEDLEDLKDKAGCDNVDTDCVMSHICYKYSTMVMAGLIEALDYFAGNQGSKVLLRILSKSVPFEMMKALDIDPNQLKDADVEDIMIILPELIKKSGGPQITIEHFEDDGYRFILDECHFLPYSKTQGFCNVTAGLMLGISQLLSNKPMDIKEIQTIAHGGSACEFVAKPKRL